LDGLRKTFLALQAKKKKSERPFVPINCVHRKTFDQHLISRLGKVNLIKKYKKSLINSNFGQHFLGKVLVLLLVSFKEIYKIF